MHHTCFFHCFNSNDITDKKINREPVSDTSNNSEKGASGWIRSMHLFRILPFGRAGNSSICFKAMCQLMKKW